MCKGSPLCLPVLCGGIRWWCGRWIHYCLVGVWFTVKGFKIHTVLCSWESGEGGFCILTGQFWTRKRRCRCFSNALQSYEKILKLTIYKQEILEKFCIGAVCCYVSSSYRACLWKHCVQRCFRRFATPCRTTILTPFWLQITDYSLFMSPSSGARTWKNIKICK